MDADKPKDTSRHPPFWCYPLLAAAVFAVSSAAVVFQMMPLVPPITLAAWRLQLTGVLLLPGAAVQGWGMGQDLRRQLVHSGLLLMASGVCLAVHFGCWVWSLKHTSLPHSLLFVSTTPVLLTTLAFLRKQPVSRGEGVGSLLALAGGIMLSYGSASESGGTYVLGDVTALAAAFAMVGYLSAGGVLRQWMPIFIYASPVTLLAAVLLSGTAAIVEGGVSNDGTPHPGIFGWMTSSSHVYYVIYLALVPGIVGHTGFNTLLRHLSPLAVALATQLEPLVGSLLGWVLGMMGPPGPWTWAGGATVFFATVMVTVAGSVRKSGEESKRAASLALVDIFRVDGGRGDDDDDEAAGLLLHTGGSPRRGARYGAGR